MSAVVWEPTLAALDAAFLLAVDGADLAIGQEIRARIAHLGCYYADLFTPEMDAAKEASEAEHAAALAAWEASYLDVFADVDRGARYAESLQEAAQVLSPAPRVCAGRVLASELAIPFTADEEPIKPAAKLLYGISASLALHVVARPGASLGISSRCPSRRARAPTR